MAAGIRSREALEDGLCNTDARVQELMNSHHTLQASLEELGDKFGQLQGTMEFMLAEFQRNLKGKGIAKSQDQVDTPHNYLRTSNHHNTEGNSSFRAPKFDFPVFNGLDIKSWILKSDHFFQFYPMNDEHKLKSVALDLEGEARIWFLAYFKSHPRVSWSQFVQDVEIRFGETSYDNALFEFNRLQQTSSIVHYQKRFEFLRSIVEADKS